MKKLILLFLFTATLFAQSPFSAPLPTIGYGILGITPAEKLWIAGRSGKLFYAPAIDSLWQTTPPLDGKDDNDYSRDTFENICIFNENTAVISGYIYGEGIKTDVIYRTDDAGKTWQKVIFGTASWLNDACFTKDGKIWASGSSGLIYYSDDFGKTWTEFKNPDPDSERLSSIYFMEDGLRGLAGSLDNSTMYSTTDNCKTWQQIPTPFSQKLYKEVNERERHTIDKIRIFGNGGYYITEQNNHIFYTKADVIQWVTLPEVTEYEVTENGGIYLIYKDGHSELRDNRFTTMWQSAVNEVPPYGSFTVRNNALFALRNDKVYRISPKGIKSNDVLTDDVPIEEPYVQLTYNNQKVGFGEYVLLFDEKALQWYRYIKAPFYVTNAGIKEGKLVISNSLNPENAVVNLQDKTIQPYETAEIINPAHEVTSIKFETGSRGCFHYFESSVNYALKKDTYKAISKKRKKGDLHLPKNITQKQVGELVALINDSQHRENSIADFKFTQTDIDRFIVFVNESEKKIQKGEDYDRFDRAMPFHGKKTDFNFYRDQAGNIQSVSPDIVNNAFKEMEGMMSTTVNWLKVTLTLKSGDSISISNNDYAPKYMHTPWQIDNNGLSFSAGTIAVGKKIDEITGGHFLKNEQKDKIYALYTIIDFMYRKKIDDELVITGK
jgi:hypothetical protein